MSTNDASTPHVGSLVAGRYRIDSVIGTGGMAVVYRATDEELGRAVALKVFRADVVDAASVQRQSEEIRLIASLDHPALVTLYDAVPGAEGDEHSTGVLVMQLVEGRDLRHRIASDGPVPPQTAAAIGADVAGALAYVHGRGVIHRDVSPANVLLPEAVDGGAPTARLADFGIARLVDSAGLTQTGTVIGTATYLSPEQAEGKPLGPSSDIYSLGLTLLEALTGERAFPGTAIESVTARLAADPDIPASLGEGWVSLLTTMTSRDQAARPTAIEAVGTLRSLEQAPVSTELMATKLLPVAETEVLGASTGPTALLPAAGATEVLHQKTVATPPPPRPADPARRRAVIIVAAVAAAAVIALILATIAGLPAQTGVAEPEPEPTASASPAAEPDPIEPTYPAVDGEVGAALAALQQLVTYDRLDEELATALQQQVLAISTSSAAGDFEAALDQLEALKDSVDAAREAGTIDEPTARGLREAIETTKKSLDEAIHAAEDDDKPGKGPKNDD